MSVLKSVLLDAEVSTFTELEDALHLVSVTNIKLMSDIDFTHNVTAIPLRDLTIDGNGFQLTTGHFAIYGADSLTDTNELTLKNLTLVGADGDGRVFEHVSRGWNVKVQDCTYTGARLVLLSRGTLTFSGMNTVTTSCENAWVENVIFTENSIYTGAAGLVGDFSAFYFNGDSRNGRASILAGAKVTIDVGNHKFPLYPAFYYNVELIEVAEEAELTINSYGYAVHFLVPQENDAKITVANQATLTLNGEGGSNFAAVRFDIKGSIVVDDGGALYITSTPKLNSAEVINMAAGSSITLGEATNMKIYNQTASAPLFNSRDTTFSINTVDAINVWGLNGGSYDSAPLATWHDVKMATVINGKASSDTTSTDDGLQANFQMSSYGCISTVSKAESV